MKTAYELAMERLSEASPTLKLTSEQKKQIAELESRFKAKVAECEIHLKDEIAGAASAGDGEKVAQLEQRLASERKKLQADFEAKKELVRQGKA